MATWWPRGRCASTCRIVRVPGLGLDVDAPEDLGMLLAEGAHTDSGRLVASWQITERLVAAGALARR